MPRNDKILISFCVTRVSGLGLTRRDAHNTGVDWNISPPLCHHNGLDELLSNMKPSETRGALSLICIGVDLAHIMILSRLNPSFDCQGPQ